MGIEIEAKMRLDDLGALEARLVDAGADRGPVINEVNTYFDTPTGLLKSSDRGLRLRVELKQGAGAGDPTVTITHKGPRSHGQVKSRSETEVGVTDAHAAVELFTALGFVPVCTFEKCRRWWHLNDCHVHIDTLPHLGDYVEIEGPSEESVLAIRQALGLGDTPLVRSSYIAMLMTCLAEKNLSPEHIRLDP